MPSLAVTLISMDVLRGGGGAFARHVQRLNVSWSAHGDSLVLISSLTMFLTCVAKKQRRMIITTSIRMVVKFLSCVLLRHRDR